MSRDPFFCKHSERPEACWPCKVEREGGVSAFQCAIGMAWTSDAYSEDMTDILWQHVARTMLRQAAREGYVLVFPSIITRSLPDAPTWHETRARVEPRARVTCKCGKSMTHDAGWGGWLCAACGGFLSDAETTRGKWQVPK